MSAMEVGKHDRPGLSGWNGGASYFANLMTYRSNLGLLLLAAVASMPAGAQSKTDKADVDWGPPLNAKEDGSFSRVSGVNDEALFLDMYYKKESQLQRMDLDLKKAYMKPVSYELDKKDLSSEGIWYVKDKVLVFSSLLDKKQDENNLFVQVYDQTSGAALGQHRKVASIPVESKRNTGGYSVKVSPDESKVMVVIEQPYEKGGAERFKAKMFDSEMTELWTQEVSMPYTDDEFLLGSSRLDNDGSVLVLGTFFPEKKEQRDRNKARQEVFDQYLLVFPPNGTDVEQHKLSLPDKYLQDITITLPENGDILCGGFYGTKDSRGAIRGTFFMKLDRRTKQIIDSSTKEFTDDFITSFWTEKEEEKAKKKAEKKDQELGLYSMDLSEIVHRDDGGALFIGEQYYMYVTTSTFRDANGRTSTTYTYHYVYNDIIVVNIDPTGEIEWLSKIPKRQHSANDNGQYSSYALQVKGENIYFIFNDSGENLFLKDGDKVQQFEIKGKDALVVLATVDAMGGVSREALFTPERRDVILKPKDCVQITDERMFIFAERKNEYRFGKVTFD